MPLLKARMHVYRVLISSCKTIISVLIFLPSHDFSSIRCHNWRSYYNFGGTILFPVCISRCPLLSAVFSHLFLSGGHLKICNHQAFISVQETDGSLQHQIRVMCRIFQDSFITKLYAMLTYFVTETLLWLSYPSCTNMRVYSCFVLN